jgi:hypothetical protein
MSPKNERTHEAMLEVARIMGYARELLDSRVEHASSPESLKVYSVAMEEEDHAAVKIAKRIGIAAPRLH